MLAISLLVSHQFLVLVLKVQIHQGWRMMLFVLTSVCLLSFHFLLPFVLALTPVLFPFPVAAPLVVSHK